MVKDYKAKKNEQPSPSIKVIQQNKVGSRWSWTRSNRNK